MLILSGDGNSNWKDFDRHKNSSPYVSLLASVAQSDARLTGDQEVAGSILTWSAKFIHGD